MKEIVLCGLTTCKFNDDLICTYEGDPDLDDNNNPLIRCQNYKLKYMSSDQEKPFTLFWDNGHSYMIRGNNFKEAYIIHEELYHRSQVSCGGIIGLFKYEEGDVRDLYEYDSKNEKWHLKKILKKGELRKKMNKEIHDLYPDGFYDRECLENIMEKLSSAHRVLAQVEVLDSCVNNNGFIQWSDSYFMMTIGELYLFLEDDLYHESFLDLHNILCNCEEIINDYENIKRKINSSNYFSHYIENCFEEELDSLDKEYKEIRDQFMKDFDDWLEN